jgi:hypothetical protein
MSPGHVLQRRPFRARPITGDGITPSRATFPAGRWGQTPGHGPARPPEPGPKWPPGGGKGARAGVVPSSCVGERPKARPRGGTWNFTVRPGGADRLLSRLHDRNRAVCRLHRRDGVPRRLDGLVQALRRPGDPLGRIPVSPAAGSGLRVHCLRRDLHGSFPPRAGGLLGPKRYADPLATARDRGAARALARDRPRRR